MVALKGACRNYDALWYCLARCRDMGSDYNIFFFCFLFLFCAIFCSVLFCAICSTRILRSQGTRSCVREP